MADESDFSVAPKKVYSVAGYENCSYYHDAVAAAEKVAEDSGGEIVSVTEGGWSRRKFLTWLEEQRRLGHVSPHHRSSPACFHGNCFEPSEANEGENSDSDAVPAETNRLAFIGGCDDFLEYVDNTYGNNGNHSSEGMGCTIS